MEKPPQRYELIKSTPVDEDSFFFRAFTNSGLNPEWDGTVQLAEKTWMDEAAKKILGE